MTFAGDHAKGLLLSVSGVIVLSPDAVLIRLIDAGSLTIVFWRNLLMALALCTVIALRNRGRVVESFRGIGLAGLAVAVLYSISSVSFVSSITLTDAANTLIIIGVSPLCAALLSRLFLGESIRLRTWLAIAGAFAGVAVLFLPSLGSMEAHLAGNLLALNVAICMSAAFTIMRAAREVDMMPALVLSGPLVGIVLIGVADPMSLPADDLWAMLLLGLVVAPLAFALISAGPRFLPAPEVGLIMLLEMVLGPLWVWAVIEETPSAYAFAGGAIVLGTLAVHSAAGLIDDRRRRQLAALGSGR